MYQIFLRMSSELGFHHLTLTFPAAKTPTVLVFRNQSKFPPQPTSRRTKFDAQAHECRPSLSSTKHNKEMTSLDAELEAWLAETEEPPLLELDLEDEGSLLDLIQEVETLEAGVDAQVDLHYKPPKEIPTTPLAQNNPQPQPKASQSQSQSVSQSQSQAKRDPRNAERCRKLRQRKKEDLRKEQQANVNLKRDRRELLRKIAELELEVQGLRGSNAVNLAKENQLLAVQVKVPTIGFSIKKISTTLKNIVKIT